MITKRYKENELKYLNVKKSNCIKWLQETLDSYKVKIIDNYKNKVTEKNFAAIVSTLNDGYMRHSSSIINDINAKIQELNKMKPFNEYKYEDYYILKRDKKVALVKPAFSKYYNIHILKWGSRIVTLDPKIVNLLGKKEILNGKSLYKNTMYTRKNFDLIAPAKKYLTEDQLNNIKSLRKDKVNREILKSLISSLDI